MDGAGVQPNLSAEGRGGGLDHWTGTVVTNQRFSSPKPARAAGPLRSPAVAEEGDTSAEVALDPLGHRLAAVTVTVANIEPSGLVGGMVSLRDRGRPRRIFHNTGSLLGAPVWTAGRYGNGLSFNGTNSYVDLTKTDVYDTLTQGTIMGWVKWNGAGWDTWFGSDSGVCKNPFELTLSDGRFEIWAAGSGCSATFNADVTLTNPTGWHHLAYVSSAAGNRIYVDGILQTPTYIRGSAATNFFLSHAAGGVTKYNIGRTANDSSETFSGVIDEVRIYNRALTGAEIINAMNAPLAP